MINFQPQKAIVFRTTIRRRFIKIVPLWEVWLDDAVKLCADARSCLNSKYGPKIPTFLSFTLSSHVPRYVPFVAADDYFIELAKQLHITILNSYITV